MCATRQGLQFLSSIRYFPPYLKHQHFLDMFLLAGDLLRAEQNREGSQYGDLIRSYIREGRIVPMEVTMKLLENEMEATLKERTTGDGWQAGCGRFLIDGFPRKMDQAIGFDEQVGHYSHSHLIPSAQFINRFVCHRSSSTLQQQKRSC